MRVVRVTVLSLICAAAAVGCADSGSLTAPAQADAAYNAANPISPNFGAIVHKDLGVGTVLGGVPPTNLVVSVGNATICPFSPASPAEGHFVETPSGKTPSHAVTREAFVQVFQFSADIIDGLVTLDLCDVAEAPLVATGTAFFTHQVNQLFGPGSGPGSFSIHVTVHGIVDLVEGGQARLQASGRVVIRPDGTVVKDQEPVTLKPL